MNSSSLVLLLNNSITIARKIFSCIFHLQLEICRMWFSFWGHLLSPFQLTVPQKQFITFNI